MNWWSPVHVGAIDCESAGAASLRIAVRAVPFTAVRPIEAEGLAKVTPVWQVPEMEKHPPERSMPLAKVEVALVPVTLRYVDCTPPEKVEVEGEPMVAAPEEALKARAAVEEVAATEEVAR